VVDLAVYQRRLSIDGNSAATTRNGVCPYVAPDQGGFANLNGYATACIIGSAGIVMDVAVFKVRHAIACNMKTAAPTTRNVVTDLAVDQRDTASID
jgi:hypothetical protein